MIIADLEKKSGIRLESIFKGIPPFLLAVVVGLLIFFLFPKIILILTNIT